MAAMRVAEVWRYPVKSLGGERLDRAEVSANGIVGDRVVHVRNGRGRVGTARTHPRLLALHATLGADEEPLINGRPWTADESAAAIRIAVGPDATLARHDGPERFDVLPLLVATDGAIAALGVDGRRLRPNLVIAGVDGVLERQWPGRRLRIGEVIIALETLRGRCVMTTYDPDTQVQDLSVLRRIVDEFDGRMALDSAVLAGGTIRVGDPVELLESPRTIGRSMQESRGRAAAKSVILLSRAPGTCFAPERRRGGEPETLSSTRIPAVGLAHVLAHRRLLARRGHAAPTLWFRAPVATVGADPHARSPPSLTRRLRGVEIFRVVA